MAIFTNIGRDLIDSPFKFNVDFSGLDGRTVVRAELIEGSRSLGTTTLNMEVHKGLHDRLSRIDSQNADVRYPVDYIANVDSGNIAVGKFDYEKELALAESALANVKAGKDPFSGKTGDFKRHYFFEEAGEIMPYRVYVPSSYRGDRGYPLLIALHGNGLTENYFFDSLNGGLQKLAEERGYIVAAPLGYRVDGGYGYNNGSRPAEDLPKLELSEKRCNARARSHEEELPDRQQSHLHRRPFDGRFRLLVSRSKVLGRSGQAWRRLPAALRRRARLR